MKENSCQLKLLVFIHLHELKIGFHCDRIFVETLIGNAWNGSLSLSPCVSVQIYIFLVYVCVCVPISVLALLAQIRFLVFVAHRSFKNPNIYTLYLFEQLECRKESIAQCLSVHSVCAMNFRMKNDFAKSKLKNNKMRAAPVGTFRNGN